VVPGRCDGMRMVKHARYHFVTGESQGSRKRKDQHRRPGRPSPFPDLERRDRLEELRGRGRSQPAVSRVVPGQQRPRIGTDGPGDGMDVPPDVEIASAQRVVVTLYAACLRRSGPAACKIVRLDQEYWRPHGRMKPCSSGVTVLDWMG
jgi:hypothetical protein